MKNLIFVIPLVWLLFACMNSIGTNDETVIRTGSIIYEPDGKTPSVGATVKVFKTNSIDGQYVSKQMTDNNGKYTLSGLPQGTYNIWAEKDSLVTFQDSVFISDNHTTVKNDTLECSSTLTGVVGVQLQHDPRSVTIQIVGSDKFFNNTDSTGHFLMKGMASGKYSLILKSTNQDYTPTTHEITVNKCSNDTLKDTLWLIYTGIPVVTGISAAYDTLNGIVHLSWTKSAYRDFESYVIYRDSYSAVDLSATPIAAVGDSTSFTDTIFNNKLITGPFSYSDTNSYHFKYWVAIRNNLGTKGQCYRYADIIALSPQKVKTSLKFSTYHLAKRFFCDSASINDTVQYTVNVANPSRPLKKLSWVDLTTGSVISEKQLDTMSKNGSDTIKYAWKTLGIKGIECKVIDRAGST